jgi:hypothetical protein
MAFLQRDTDIENRRLHDSSSTKVPLKNLRVCICLGPVLVYDAINSAAIGCATRVPDVHGTAVCGIFFGKSSKSVCVQIARQGLLDQTVGKDLTEPS